MQSSGQYTPCAGRCSTVFGDLVCRGCLRTSTEVIQWNSFSPAQQQLIWMRLDQQLQLIVLPLLTVNDPVKWQSYKAMALLKLPPYANEARWRYEVFKRCLKSPTVIAQTGLNIVPSNMHTLWAMTEKKLHTLAMAIYQMSWQRAYQTSIPQSTLTKIP